MGLCTHTMARIVTLQVEILFQGQLKNIILFKTLDVPIQFERSSQWNYLISE